MCPARNALTADRAAVHAHFYSLVKYFADYTVVSDVRDTSDVRGAGINKVEVEGDILPALWRYVAALEHAQPLYP